MYKKNKIVPSALKVNESYEGETIEQKLRRITNNKEPISEGAQLIYTERKYGVQPEYDVRTDKWEIAVEAMDKVSKTHIAKRDERHKAGNKPEGEQAKNGMKPEGGQNDNGTKPEGGQNDK